MRGGHVLSVTYLALGAAQPVGGWAEVQFLGREDPLKKEMATHSSILAWRIPWTEEPAGYSPWGGKSPTRLSD